jgi:hypothetical protein
MCGNTSTIQSISQIFFVNSIARNISSKNNPSLHLLQTSEPTIFLAYATIILLEIPIIKLMMHSSIGSKTYEQLTPPVKTSCQLVDSQHLHHEFLKSNLILLKIIQVSFVFAASCQLVDSQHISIIKNNSSIVRVRHNNQTDLTR